METHRDLDPSALRSAVARLALIGVAATAACGGPAREAPKSAATPAPAPKPSASAEATKPKFDYQGFVNREAPEGKKVHVASKSLDFEADVESPTEPVWGKSDKTATLTFPLGGEGKAQCFVYAEHIDAGAVIGRMIAGLEAPVHVEAVRPAGMSVVAERPVLFAEVQYTAQDGATKVAGMLKAAVTAGDGGSLFCIHDEVGYRETFKRVVSGIASSAKWPATAALVPRRHEIAVLELNGQPAGFAESNVFDGEKGVRVVSELVAALLPTSPTTLVGKDDLEIHELDAAGNLASAKFYSAVNGEEKTSLDFKRTAPRAYAVAGMHEGKDVKTTFKSKVDLTYSFAKRAAIRGLTKKPGSELKIATFSPSQSTTGASEELYRSEPDGRIHVIAGEHEGLAKIDADGLVDTFEIAKTPVTVTFRRVFVSGAP